MSKLEKYMQCMAEFESEFENLFVNDPRIPDKDTNEMENELLWRKYEKNTGTNFRQTIQTTRVKLENKSHN